MAKAFSVSATPLAYTSAKLFRNDDPDTLVETIATLNPGENDESLFTGSITAAVTAGVYRLVLYDGTNAIWYAYCGNLSTTRDLYEFGDWAQADVQQINAAAVKYVDAANPVPADAVQISGDSTAADNLESAADGTGYNLGGGAVVAASVTSKTGYALTADYDAAKTAAQAGDEMDLIDAPNPTAVAAIQNGLATQISLNALVTTIGVSGAGLTDLGGMSTGMKAEVNAEADTALADFTGDTGITLAKALEMLAAFMAGKVTSSSDGTTTTYTYKKRDGTTTSFTSVCIESDGLRASTGALS